MGRFAVCLITTSTPICTEGHHFDERTVVGVGEHNIASLEPSVYLKRKMHGKHNLLFGLTNEAFGYNLTKVEYQSFPRYDYVSRTSLGEMTGEILIEKALELVNKSPAPDR